MPRPKRTLEESRLAREVGQRLRQIRGPLSREEFVHQLEIGTRRSIADYEAGKVVIPSDVAYRVCTVCGVNFFWLMRGLGPMRQNETYRNNMESFCAIELKAVEGVISGFLERSNAGKQGFPDFENPRDLLALAVKIAKIRWLQYVTPLSLSFADFIRDLLHLTEEFLGQGRQMKEAKDFQATWSALKSGDAKFDLLGRLFPGKVGMTVGMEDRPIEEPNAWTEYRSRQDEARRVKSGRRRRVQRQEDTKPEG